MAFAIRATQRVLRRVASKAATDVAPPTTALGDWYVNLLHVGKTQLVLCTSDRSLLSVVLPARRLKMELHPRLCGAVGELLSHLKVPNNQITRELAEMETATLTRTASRSVLGSMNDFAILIDAAFRVRPPSSFGALSVELAGVPCGPLRPGQDLGFPDRVARRLLGAVDSAAG